MVNMVSVLLVKNLRIFMKNLIFIFICSTMYHSFFIDIQELSKITDSQIIFVGFLGAAYFLLLDGFGETGSSHP